MKKRGSLNYIKLQNGSRSKKRLKTTGLDLSVSWRVSEEPFKKLWNRWSESVVSLLFKEIVALSQRSLSGPMPERMVSWFVGWGMQAFSDYTQDVNQATVYEASVSTATPG